MNTRPARDTIPVIHQLITMNDGENYWFNGCAKYVMECLGEKDFTYAFFAGLTGDVLAQVYPIDRFRGNGVTDMVLSEAGDGAFIEKVFAKCGYASRYITQSSLRKNTAMYKRMLADYIGRGIPVIWRHWDYPSWCVIVGYEDHGSTLLYLTEEKTVPERATLDEVLSEPSNDRWPNAGLLFIGEKEREIDLAAVYRDVVLGLPKLLTTKTEHLLYGAAAFRAKADEIESGRFDRIKPEDFDDWGMYKGFICDLATNASCCYEFYDKALAPNPDLAFIEAVKEECRKMSALWEGEGGLESLGAGLNATLEALQDKDTCRAIAAILRECARCVDNVADIITNRRTIPMAEPKKLRVCKKCSGFDVAELKGKLKAKDYTTGCIGKCAGKEPALTGKAYGFINGEFTVCDTKEDFFSKIEGLA